MLTEALIVFSSFDIVIVVSPIVNAFKIPFSTVATVSSLLIQTGFSITEFIGSFIVSSLVSLFMNTVNSSSSSDSIAASEVVAYAKRFFYDHAGRLLFETKTSTSYSLGDEYYEIAYLYDQSSMVGMELTKNNQSTLYYFQRNLLGDVVAIYDTNGTLKVRYIYDAWGNCTIASGSDMQLAIANPIRYRGYYYDQDTGLYYLNARYYSPELRRFISPDDTAYLDPENANGLNLYAYCCNDPVNYADPSGYAPEWLQGLAIGLAIVGAVLVIGAVTVLTFGVGTLAGTMTGAVIYGAAQGIAIGAAVGVVGGGIVGGIASDWSAEGILIGVGIGLGAGAIVGGVIGGIAGASSFTANSTYISQHGGNVKQVLSAYKGNPRLKVLDSDTTVYRTWGGVSGEVGHWTSPKNYGPAARKMLSLPPENTAVNTSTFLISKGSTVLSGKAAALFGQPGGGIQWWIGLL